MIEDCKYIHILVKKILKRTSHVRAASSYLKGSTDLDLRNMTLAELLRESAEYCPDKDICKFYTFYNRKTCA